MVTTQSATGGRVFDSKALHLLTEHIGRRSRRSHVLDLGPPRQSILDFFARAGARLHIADTPRFLRNHDIAFAADCHHVPASKFAFEELLADAEGPYQIVLAWDYFNYFNRDTIICLMSRLNSLCSRGTLLYFITIVEPHMPDVPARIELDADGALHYQTDRTYLRNSPRYAPKVLENMMPSFRMQHMFLLQNGLQEHVYAFSRPKTPPRLNVLTETSLLDFSTPVSRSGARPTSPLPR